MEVNTEKICPGCISETVTCTKLILGRDGVGVARGVGMQRHGCSCDLEFENLVQLISQLILGSDIG